MERLVDGREWSTRSLVTSLRAAKKFDASHLSSPKVAPLVEGAKVFYVEGFFLSHGVESVLALSKHASENNKVWSTASLLVASFSHRPNANSIDLCPQPLCALYSTIPSSPAEASPSLHGHCHWERIRSSSVRQIHPQIRYDRHCRDRQGHRGVPQGQRADARCGDHSGP